MKIFRTGAYETLYDLPIRIDWGLTRRCNYRCSYCFNYGKDKKPPLIEPFSTLAQLKTAVDNIASLNRPWYEVTLSGGEPTIHPHIFDLIVMFHETLQERLSKILIISNGSRNTAFYKNIASIAKSMQIEMQISIHTEYVDMTHILELIGNLSRDVNIYFALMFNPDKREEVRLIYEILFEYRKRFPFTMNVVPLRDDYKLDPRYTQEDMIWQREATMKFKALVSSVEQKIPLPKQPGHSFRIFHDIEEDGERKIVETTNRTLNFANGLLNFKGMYCVAHSALLNIQADGLCRGMVCPVAPFVCNIFQENAFKDICDKIIYAVQCPMEICGCPANDCLPKFSSREEALRFIQIATDKQNALFNGAH